ncbi:hypothetical protein AC578_517 [Pseudocercospora eumusae]|uniref:Uncharacterized protein n=1 Tax=Pseudocercospora eumusae TaxID=321146 RepID=A0A139HY14_9PEZI|nr:hypothetical protein AC578_517 [Pseudocercospora eumusae]
MTPSEERTSSVNRLRSLFENKNDSSASPSARGRSPAGLRSDDSRPKSKVTASFFPVDSPNRLSGMASPPDAEADKSALPNLNREPSTGRRTSFSEDKDSAVAEAVKDSVHAEHERRKANPLVAETIPETAVETQRVEPNNQRKKKKKQETTVDERAENPDKHVTGAGEDPAVMKPAQPTDELAVSGGDALSLAAEDLRKPDAAPSEAASKTDTDNGKAAAKPPAITTKSAPRPSTSSVKSSRTASTAPVAPPKAPTKKPSRSSLTAPTAASVARAAAADKSTAAGVKQSSAPKPKPRETTTPLNISSRLTAPTAASRAKHEAPAAPEPKSTATRARSTASTRATPRPSLGRPQSRTSEHEARKSGTPVSGSFLERMTRPTAASSGRTQKEPEVKNPPKSQKLPHRPKANGHPKSAASPAVATPDETEVETSTLEEPSVVQEDESREEAIESAAQPAVEDVAEEQSAPEAVSPAAATPTASEQTDAKSTTVEVPAGEETPVPSTNGRAEDPPALEGTPAALASEDSIR